MSVQLGFVVGALGSALLNLADRWRADRLFALSALAGAAANGAIPLLAGVDGAGSALALRFLTGVALAGVYPPGMKLVATWTKADRGLGIGILVGALTLGSAAPHLLNALPLFGAGGMPPWPRVLWAASALAVAAAAIAGLGIHEGPHRPQGGARAPFDWRFVGRVLAHRPTRLANLGYLGHMW
jgi:MFS family permease